MSWRDLAKWQGIRLVAPAMPAEWHALLVIMVVLYLFLTNLQHSFTKMQMYDTCTCIYEQSLVDWFVGSHHISWCFIKLVIVTRGPWQYHRAILVTCLIVRFHKVFIWFFNRSAIGQAAMLQSQLSNSKVILCIILRPNLVGSRLRKIFLDARIIIRHVIWH